MVTVGLLVRLEAKPGREQDVEDFLRIGLSYVLDEPATLDWYAIRLGPSTFGSSTRSRMTRAAGRT